MKHTKLYVTILVVTIVTLLFVTRHMDAPIGDSGSDAYLQEGQLIGDPTACYHYIYLHEINNQVGVKQEVICK